MQAERLLACIAVAGRRTLNVAASRWPGASRCQSYQQGGSVIRIEPSRERTHGYQKPAIVAQPGIQADQPEKPGCRLNLGVRGQMIRARTRVQFLSAEEGGRTKPAFRGYSPNHNFGSPNDREMQMGRFELAEGQQVNPGETAEVTICFAGADNLQLLVCAGRQWRIQEGGQLVAIGTVLEVAHDP